MAFIGEDFIDAFDKLGRDLPPCPADSSPAARACCRHRFAGPVNGDAPANDTAAGGEIRGGRLEISTMAADAASSDQVGAYTCSA